MRLSVEEFFRKTSLCIRFICRNKSLGKPRSEMSNWCPLTSFLWSTLSVFLKSNSFLICKLSRYYLIKIPISDSSWKIRRTVHELTFPRGHHRLQPSGGWCLWMGHVLFQVTPRSTWSASPTWLAPVRIYL